jgi:hypothetical protein
MQYQNLKDAVVTFNESQAVDLDQDGVNDMIFGLNPLDDARPGYGFDLQSRDRVEMYADKGDSIPALVEGTFIREIPQDPWHWDREASLLCSFESGTLNGDEDKWEGYWTHVSNRYLGVRLRRGALWYPGWIRMSMDTNLYILVLHDAAISVEPADLIEAGVY